MTQKVLITTSSLNIDENVSVTKLRQAGWWMNRRFLQCCAQAILAGAALDCFEVEPIMVCFVKWSKCS